MSTASKVTLAATSLVTIGIIISVHYGQKAERAVCTQMNFGCVSKTYRQCMLA